MAKQVLGRGLSALLTEVKDDVNSASDQNAGKIIGKIANIDIDIIEVNPFQPRTKFDPESLGELAESIRQLGLVQPITVRKTGFNTYQLVSGERRLRASKLAGLTAVPAYVRLADDQQMLEMALIENIQRVDLDPIEVALSYQRLIDECALTQEQMSERVGKKRSTITNYLRLLRLDPMIQTGMRDEIISMGHGRALINVDNIEVQLMIYEMIVRDQLSVRQAEALVKAYHDGDFDLQEGAPNAPAKQQKNKEVLPVNFSQVKLDLAKKLDSKIDIKLDSASGKGKIIISFKSEAEFERIKNLL